MASSLTADTFYNLSTQHQFNYNKEFIYVKLTDSALRAIEDYVRNQFVSFPTFGNNGSNQPMEQKFSFSLTEEEKQGSFECLQHTPGQMNVMGPIQQRIRVQAQEDVYENTKSRMAEAAQIKKKTCTREIKPNQTDIGRKITKKAPSITPSPYSQRTTTSGQQQLSSSAPNSLISNGKRQLESNSISGDGLQQQSASMSHHSSQQQSISATSSHSYNTTSSSQQDHHHHHDTYQQHNSAINGVVGDDVDNHLRHGSASGMGLTSSRNNGQQNHRNPDIMRKPIKERLIHLLALRPFKKPELYDRLIREGIRDRDRSVILNVLRSISYIRDNAYVLNRHIWNDVHEDWPFYSEQDRSTLKRRKPQNLTPPLSSDGGSSSTSGQSPNSQHNGSPPPAVKRPSSQAPLNPNNNMNSSNLSIEKYLDPAPKKMRISRVQNADSMGGMRTTNSYDAPSFMNSRARDSDDYYGSNTTPNSLEDSGLGLNYTTLTTDTISKRVASPINGGQSKSSHGGSGSNNDQRSQRNGGNRTNGTTQSNLSSSSYDTTSNIEDGFRESVSKNGSTKAGFSDYPPITSVEQRRKYKTEFDKDYAEYRQLHLIMDKARRRFANLQQELSNANPSERKYKEIQNQIIQEYKENHNNTFQERKQRFDYLHLKLSHIKQLVSDFDSRLTKGNVNADPQPTAHAAY